MANWLEKFEEQLLVRELLDDHELPVSVCDHLTNDASSYLVSNVDGGVWKARSGNESNEQSTGLPNGAGVSILEKKGLDKMDYKYTLKIKSCGNALSDDGYKWRKYGQKSIKNSPYPRSYFRCTNPRCAAKKQVERCSSDPDTLIITYEGLHLHFTFSHSLSPTQANQTSPPLKKFKRTTSATQGDTSGQGKGTDGPPLTSLAQLSSTTMFDSQLDLFEGAGSQGLLEDMVPLSILKPSILNKLSNSSSSPSTLNNLSNSSSSSPSYPSSPLTSSSSSLTWSPDFFSFDVGATSSIL